MGEQFKAPIITIETPAGMGWSAYFSDPAGNVVGIYKGVEQQ